MSAIKAWRARRTTWASCQRDALDLLKGLELWAKKKMDKACPPITHLATLLCTDQVRVAEFALAPGAEGPYHFHTHVREHCLCLEGIVHLEERDGHLHILHAGKRCEIQEGRVHRVSNHTSAPSRYLVIQGVGAYDFQISE